MASITPSLILGEYSRRLDDRFRFTLPGEVLSVFQPSEGDCVLAKERPGCISLWEKAAWDEKMKDQIELIQQRLKMGRLEQQIPQLQMLGRLLSTRHRPVRLAGRGRLMLPEGFREFLKVESGGEVMIVGAAVCIEIWNPARWISYIEGKMPKFRKLLDNLSN